MPAVIDCRPAEVRWPGRPGFDHHLAAGEGGGLASVEVVMFRAYPGVQSKSSLPKHMVKGFPATAFIDGLLRTPLHWRSAFGAVSL
jgi:hypothetical protein